MHWYTVVKFLHIVAVVWGGGGLFARQLLSAQAKKATDIQSLAGFVRAAGKMDTAMVIPGMTAMFLLGIVVALIGGVPILGFLQGASQNWLLAANILLIGIFVLIPTVLVPRSRGFDPILQAAVAKGQITPELRAALDDNAVRLAHWYEEGALIVIAALMVLKPF